MTKITKKKLTSKEEHGIEESYATSENSLEDEEQGSEFKPTENSDHQLLDGSYVHEPIRTAQGISNANYCPVTKVNTFHKIRKRPQCKVCGEFGHMKSRCPLNPEKTVGRKPKPATTIREGKPSVPSIVEVTTGPIPTAEELLAEAEKDEEDGTDPKTIYSVDHDEPSINRSWAEAHFKDSLWDMRYDALVKYGEENGTCNCPHTYKCKLTDGSFTNLGQWLQDQRKEKRHGNLKPNRLERLQTLVDEGLLEWKPLRSEEKKWYIRFQAVVNFAVEHGHLDLPNEEVLLDDGTKADLERWFTKEVQNLKSNKLSADKDQLFHDHLVVPGYMSEEDYGHRSSDRKISGESQWLSKYEALLSYGLTNGGDYNVPKEYFYLDETGKEIQLGAWLQTQRKEYKNQTLPRHREEKLSALVEHGFKWDASYKSEQWEKRYEALVKFYDEFKTCNVPHSYKFTDEDGAEVALGRWLEHQRRCKKLKTLLPDRDRKLQQLVDEKKLYWDIYEADKRFRAWQDNFNLLVAYGDLHGSCELPENAIIVTMDKNENTKKVHLGYWLAQQKIAKYHNKLEIERVHQLDRLVNEGKLSWDVSDLVLSMSKSEDILIRDETITQGTGGGSSGAAGSSGSNINAGNSSSSSSSSRGNWIANEDMASDSEDEGVNLKVQTVTSSSSHRGVGAGKITSTATKRAKTNGKAVAAAEEEEENEDDVLFDTQKSKKPRRKG